MASLLLLHQPLSSCLLLQLQLLPLVETKQGRRLLRKFLPLQLLEPLKLLLLLLLLL